MDLTGGNDGPYGPINVTNYLILTGLHRIHRCNLFWYYAVNTDVKRNCIANVLLYIDPGVVSKTKFVYNIYTTLRREPKQCNIFPSIREHVYAHIATASLIMDEHEHTQCHICFTCNNHIL